jgi:hypothetical protein
MAVGQVRPGEPGGGGKISVAVVWCPPWCLAWVRMDQRGGKQFGMSRNFKGRFDGQTFACQPHSYKTEPVPLYTSLDLVAPPFGFFLRRGGLTIFPPPGGMGKHAYNTRKTHIHYANEARPGSLGYECGRHRIKGPRNRGTSRCARGFGCYVLMLDACR